MSRGLHDILKRGMEDMDVCIGGIATNYRTLKEAIENCGTNQCCFVADLSLYPPWLYGVGVLSIQMICSTCDITQCNARGLA